MFEPKKFYDPDYTKHKGLVLGHDKPWDIVRGIPQYIRQILEKKDDNRSRAKIHRRAILEGLVFVGADSEVDANAIIRGPVYIGERCRIGANALIRPNTIIADGATVGYNCEVKASLILEGAIISHFCFIGDSLIGRNVNLGSRTTTANFPHAMPMIDDGSRIEVNYRDYGRFMVGLRHLGAMIGDGCRLGCHTVLNPGTLIGMNVKTYPNLALKGYIPQDSIVRQGEPVSITPRSRRNKASPLHLCS